MRKLLLLLLLSLSLISLISAYDGISPYEIKIEQVGDYRSESLIHYLNDSEWLFNKVEIEDIRPFNSVSYPNYSLSYVGDNYYIDTWVSPVGRMYHISMYGSGWYLDAVVYKIVKEDRLDYKVECKDQNKKLKKHKCK